MTLIHEYLFYQEKYSKKYGKDKTIVLMQVGSFHEAYSTNEKGYNLSKLSELVNLTCTRKDKSIIDVSEKNPNMLGFPSVALQKYLKMLIELGFTVIIIDQVSPPPQPKREVTGIYSPGTYIQESFSPDSNNIICIYFEEEIQKNNTVLMCMGMSVVDLSTGDNTVNESYSKKGDEKYCLDEAVRFINSFNPKEIIIYRKLIKDENIKGIISKDKLINYLEITNKNYKYSDKINKNFFKLSYQNEFLKRAFPNTGLLTPIEYLDFAMISYARISYIILLDYAYQHNENIIKNLYKPKIFEDKKHLILGNNAIYQLNIFENDNQTGPTKKFKCLFDVVNNTSTAMGRRFLKDTLSAPLVSSKEIKNRYSLIEEMKKNDNIDLYEENLKYILDLERIHRKLSLKLLHPQEFVDMIYSYYEVKKIILKLLSNKYFKSILPEKKIIKKTSEFVLSCEKKFNLDEMKKYNINDITNSFFIKGKHKDLDKLQNEIDEHMDFMNNICTVLSNYINDSGKAKLLSKNENKVYLKKNDRDGYYLSLTKLRADSLIKNLKKIKSLKITEKLEIKVNDLEFKKLAKGNTKIFFKNNRSDKLILLREKIMNLTKDYYVKELDLFYFKYKDIYYKLTQFISKLDFIKSSAKTANIYGYNKPNITIKKKYDNSFISCKKLRHPIIERINTDIEYIPHDINIGFDFRHPKKNHLNGMLVYGLNSVGKSSLMKALGLNLVMAQCGMFVSCEEFNFSPYESIFARITGNDNIFKGLSSFALEMTELRAILTRTSPKTLVIGDEVCRGTEYTSANSIVAATIISLAKTNSSFMFATHLHDIPKLKRIKNLKNVKAFHLTVEYDKENDMLKFDRLLKDGPGKSVYGITVAKYIIHDNEFIKLAQEVKNEIQQKSNKLLPDNSSRYNSSIYLDKCEVCDKKVNDVNDFIGYFDTHHINHQKDCTNGFVNIKPYLKMNSKANLIVLCKNCHHDAHHNKLNIVGYTYTSKGRILQFNKIKKKKKKNKFKNKCLDS